MRQIDQNGRRLSDGWKLATSSNILEHHFHAGTADVSGGTGQFS
jgi:hypothetical protein